MFSASIGFLAALLTGVLGFGFYDTGADGIFQIATFALLGYTGVRLLMPAPAPVALRRRPDRLLLLDPRPAGASSM